MANQLRWYSFVTREQWNVLFAAQLGWMLDAMDVMLYAFALTAIKTEFALDSATAGARASATLITSAVGGIVFGRLADRMGRAKALIYAILTYSLFTALTATAGTLAQLVLWRALVGIGLGGEWSAGSVLVSEVWPAEHRGKAIGFMQAGWAIGYIIAALLSATILPTYGWRVLFVIGVFPALLTLWIRSSIKEPEVWSNRERDKIVSALSMLSIIFRPPLLKRTVIASLLTTSVLFAYWGLFTWMPTFLSTPVQQGGAGMSIVKSSGWIVPMQIGAFFGYTLFGFFADRFGRRPVFLAFLVLAAVLVPVYGQLGNHELVLLIMGPFIGFFGHGYFSVFGAMLAELFSTNVLGTAQGLTYNIGRGFSALAPFTIGALADMHGIGTALALTSAFFLAGAGLMFFLPETRGQQLL
ncbi:MAG: MFS transporter [Ignavibacteriales bacterium]|nr:MFS transporter [Ignavibacteriales bacterium]